MRSIREGSEVVSRQLRKLLPETVAGSSPVPSVRKCHNCGSPNIQVLRDNKRELLITCSRCHCDKWFLRGYRGPKLDE